MWSPDARDVEDRIHDRRLSARHRQRADAAFERGDALLEHVGRRVHDPRVDVAELFEREKPRGMARCRRRRTTSSDRSERRAPSSPDRRSGRRAGRRCRDRAWADRYCSSGFSSSGRAAFGSVQGREPTAATKSRTCSATISLRRRSSSSSEASSSRTGLRPPDLRISARPSRHADRRAAFLRGAGDARTRSAARAPGCSRHCRTASTSNRA